MFAVILLLALACIKAAAQAGPSQIHIAFAGNSFNATGMRVQWKTHNKTTPVCQYGLSPSNLTNSVVGESVEYYPGHGFHHHAKLHPLVHDTVYYYRCGTYNNMSPIYNFVSSPKIGRKPEGFSAMIFGDMGLHDSEKRPMLIALEAFGLFANWSASLSRDLIEKMHQEKQIDFILHVGDIAYADNSFTHYEAYTDFTYDKVWDEYALWFENVTTEIPYMVSVGNHEAECHDLQCITDPANYGLYFNNFTAYNARYVMPSRESGGVASMWYSFQHQNVHFISLDTSTGYEDAPEGKQGTIFPYLPSGGFDSPENYERWVIEDLKKASENPDIDWIVAVAHRPLKYLTDEHRDFLIDAFRKYGVDLFLGGHGHSYIRDDISRWGDDVVHIMVGGAGNEEMRFPEDQFDPLHFPEPIMTAPQVIGNGKSKKVYDMHAGHEDASYERCRKWCMHPEVRFGYEHMKTDNFKTEWTNAGVITDKEFLFETPEDFLYRVLGKTDVHDPCDLCGEPGNPENPPPVFTNANMALGKLDVDGDTLTWSLLRAPDGEVLDRIILKK